MPDIIVDAGNDDAPASRRKHTSIEVSGSDFPPGSAVNIKIDPGSHRGTANVRPDGRFDFVISVRPQLKCRSVVTAIVHGSDGIVVEGEDNVFCPGDVP